MELTTPEIVAKTRYVFGKGGCCNVCFFILSACWYVEMLTVGCGLDKSERKQIDSPRESIRALSKEWIRLELLNMFKAKTMWVCFYSSYMFLLTSQ